ncbi:MAG: signal peptidase I [Phycisphaerae bacterium]
MTTRKNKTRLLKFWREMARPFLVVLIVVGSFRSAVADWNDVPTGSMKPTIVEGDRIFVNKLAYALRVPFTNWRLAAWSQPERGDVVVFFSPSDSVRMVKRVVGLPGDRIEMRNNRLFVNGEVVTYEPLDPAVINQIPADEQQRYRFAGEKIDGRIHPVMLTPTISSQRSFDAVTVPDGHYFLMGDNRDNSRDSRWFGFVGLNRIVGRATSVVFSFNPDRHYFPRWRRFFRSLS